MIKAKLKEVCSFDPPKSEARESLKSDDLVGFMPMKDLGIESKNAKASSSRPLNEVIKAYTYFAEKDVLVAKITPCFENGKMGIARDLENKIGFGSSEYFVLRPGASVMSEYIYYFLRQEFVINNGKEIMTGAVGHKRIPSDYLENLEIPLPTLEKQREIVEKLDSAFAEIDLLEKNLDQNSEFILEIEASLVANLWVKYANELTVKRLEDVADYKNGSAHEKIVDENGDFIIVNSKFISSNGLKFKRSSKQLTPLKIGDVTMVLSDVPNGKALAKCFLVDKDDTYTLNQRICKLTSEILLPEFLSLNMNRNPYLLSFNNGENQTNLRLNDVLKTPIYVANKATQKLITDEFLEAKRTILEYSKMNLRKAESLNLLKQSLLVSNFSDLERDVA